MEKLLVKKYRLYKRILSIILSIAVLFTSLGLEGLAHSAEASAAYTTIYLKDDTAQHWIGNDNAVIELVDNTDGHEHYIMHKDNSTTWSVKVPASTYNVTFNRLSPDKSTQWNSWSAGGRGSNRDDRSTWHSTYHATVPEHGYWDGEAEYEEGFHEGDVIYLDYYEFNSWEISDALFYVNFTEAKKSDNNGADINIGSADKSKFSPVLLKDEIEEQVYTYTVTAEDEGATKLRFWRGNSSTLWNYSVTLSYKDYQAGNNCVKVQGWNDTGYVCPYVPRRHVPVFDTLELNVAGNKKVNRKITLDFNIQGETQYLNTQDTQINIVKVDSDGNAISDNCEGCFVFDENATEWNHRELIFKKSGAYKITALATDGIDNFTDEKIINIAEDNSPVAGMKLINTDEVMGDDAAFIRNSQGILNLDIRDESVCEVGDDIVSRHYTIFYDANNNGEYEEDEVINEISGNETAVSQSFDKVGKYMVSLSVQETYTDTIPKLITDSDYLKDEVKKEFEIVNQAPSSSMSVKKSKIADIIFTVGSADKDTLSAYAEATEKVKEKLEEQGIEANVSTISTSALTATDTFAWKEYDHCNFNDGGQVLPNHIQYTGKDIKMVGYYYTPFNDFLYIDDSESGRKIFDFDLQRDQTDWHSMEGGGFLFNTIVSDEENYIQGYCILVTSNGLKLVQINKTDLSRFRNNVNNLQDVGRLLQTFPLNNLYDNHHFKIVVDGNNITVYDGETIVINKYILPDDGMDVYGYGPITSHRSHACYQQSYFTFKNIIMQTVTGESLSDVVNNHEWTPGENHYVINLSSVGVPELSDNDRMSDVSAALISNNVSFYGIGNETTVNQYNALSNTIDGAGQNIELTEDISVGEAVEGIVSSITADINSKNYDIDYAISSDEKVEYTDTYSDPEGDDKAEEVWTYEYNPSVFGTEDSGMEDIQILNYDSPITIFENTGAYTISHKASDDAAKGNDSLADYSLWSDEDNYKKLILSHHRPVADMSVTATQSKDDSNVCLVNVQYSSYDDDHRDDKSNGIRKEEFYYKEIGDSKWTSGRFPASVAMGTIYLVKYIVTDVEGEKSRPKVVAVKTNEAREYVEPEDNNPPTVKLDVSDTTVEVGKVFYVEASAEDDYGIVDFSVRHEDEEIGTTYGRFECSADEPGEYVITVSATDIGGNTVTDTKTVNIIDSSDVTPPTIDITSPSNGSISGDTDIIGTIKDDKKLKSYKVTRTGTDSEPEVIAYGTEEVTDGVIATIVTEGLDGEIFRYDITAEDMAGHTTTVTCTVRVTEDAVDTIAPEAIITDIVLDSENAAISVYGTVEDETSLSEYTLYVGNSDTSGQNEPEQILIGSGSENITDGIIGTINTDDIAGGTYVLTLKAKDAQGNTCENEAQFTYVKGTTGDVIEVDEDINAPVIAANVIAGISDKGLNLVLRGTIDDENLASYSVVTGKADEEGNIPDKINISSGTEPVYDTDIAEYTYGEYEPGQYKVIVTARDMAGNERTTAYTVTINSNGLIDNGYAGDDADSAVNLTLSKTTANVGETVRGYIEYPKTATDVKVTADRADVVISGRTADITAEAPGEVCVTLSAVVDGETKTVTKTVRFFDTADRVHPTADFISPESDCEIHTKTDIYATIKDETSLAYYVLEYKPYGMGSDQYHEIARGTESVENEKIGELDTSLLMNGSYVLRITAVDNGGNRIRVERTINVAGNLKVGNMSLGFTDINSNVSGIPLTVTRNYDSRNKSSGDFGTGWTLGIQSASLTESNDITTGYELVQQGERLTTCYYMNQTLNHDITVAYGDGTSDRFELKVTPQRSILVPIYEVKVNFQCVTDKKVTLELEGDNSAIVSGGQLLFEQPDMLENRNYILTRADGTKLYLSPEYGLLKMEDRNGNTVSITKNGYKHSSGNSVLFTRDEQGRITTAEEKNSGGDVITSISYSYDESDNLAAVTDKAGRTVVFTYDDDHNLIDIIDPSGIAVARNIYDEEGRLTATVDADGNRTEYEHDLDAKMEVVRDKLGNATVYYYDDYGNVLRKVDALGNTTYATYDDNNNLLTETDGNGNVTSYTYDTNGNVIGKVLPDGTEVSNIYTQDNRISAIKLEDTIIGTIDYNSKGYIDKVEDANGNEVSYEYTNGDLASITDDIGVYQKFTYDSNGNVISSTNGNDEVTKYSYDEKGNLTGTERIVTQNGETKTVTTSYVYDNYGNIVQSTNSEGNVMTYFYDANGNNIKVTDSQNRSILYEYDNLGNITKTIYPDNTTESFSYDANGNNLTATDRNGNTCNMTYDKLDRLVKKEYTSGCWEEYVYDSAGNLIQQNTSSGASTTYSYNSRGLNTEITDTYGAVTKFEYDDAAHLTSITDAQGNETTYTYDGAGNEIQVTYPDGASTKSEYDSRSRIISSEDAYGNKTKYEYDNADRLTKVTDALNNSYEYGYNESGNLVKITDASGNVTKYTYDTNGNILSIENALGNRQTYTYNADGNVSAYKDYNGNVTTFEYDYLGRCISKDSADGVTSYTYEDDLLVSASENGYTTAYAYDDFDRLIQKTDINGNVIKYTYDSESRISTISVNDKAVLYEYDKSDRVVRVIDHNGQATVYEYDSLGNRSKVTYANGTVLTYVYDACQRLKEECLTDAGGNILAKYSYTLGKDGEKLSATEIDENGNVTEISYTYDAVLRLTKEVIENNGSQLINEYTYDAVSNRTKKVTTITGDAGDVIKAAQNEQAAKETGDSYSSDVTEGTTLYKYNAVYQLTKEESTKGTIVYEYDNNGNLLKQSGVKNVEYKYDSSNQLISVVSKEGGRSSKETYVYDCSGNRVSKTVDGITTIYVIDSSSGLSEVVGKIKKNESNETIFSEVYTMNGTERISVVKYTGDDVKQSEHFYVISGHGDIRNLTDVNGDITDKYTYDAYGNILKSSGVTENEFLYTGEQYNESTELYYLRARYMDPSAGRFIGLDSYQGDRNDPISLHKYLYANANPVSYTDPTGNFAALLALMAVNGEAAKAEAAHDAWCIKVGYQLMTAFAAFSAVSMANSVAYELQWSLANDTVSLGLSLASYVTTKLLETNLPIILYITVTSEMAAVQKAVEKIKIEEGYRDHSVYLLRQRDDKKVMYVGITSQDPHKREEQHQNDNLPVNKRHPKKTGDEYWYMQVVFTGLTKSEARAMEQSLICIYTFDALSNARYEISVKNIDGFESEVKRMASLLKIDESGLLNLVRRKEWSGE